MNTGTVNDRRVESAVTDRVTEGVTITDLPRLSSYEFEESGVVLWVTPTISLENIDLSILTSVADLLSFDDTGKPLLNTRAVATNVRAKSGEEIVLGGINRDHSIKTTRKIPFLGSIPVLGYLFGGEITSKQVTTVVEVVTPTLIENCSGTTEADVNAIAQVETGAPVPLPRDEYGFDQYLLDPMKAK
jgi:type II secretory pathway component GspD/PulD (secretin)